MRGLAIRLILFCGMAALALAQQAAPPKALPATAVETLKASLLASRPHAAHVWRDTTPVLADGLTAAYVEIARGDRRKWEYAPARNARVVDRVIPGTIGGYPVNYGFVPQTIAWDGDPFDALVLGPPIDGGTIVVGRIVGLLLMDDEKGHDAKVVLSPVDDGGQALHALDADARERIARFFAIYKRHEPGARSVVRGWDDAAAGVLYVDLTRAFFAHCSHVPAGDACFPH